MDSRSPIMKKKFSIFLLVFFFFCKTRQDFLGMTPQMVLFFRCISFHLEFVWVYRVKQKSNPLLSPNQAKLFTAKTKHSKLEMLSLLYYKSDYIWFCFCTFFDPLYIFVLISYCFDQCSFQNILMFNMESLVISLLHLIFKNSLTILAQFLFLMKFKLNIFSLENSPCAL